MSNDSTYILAICNSNGHICSEISFDSEEARIEYRRGHQYQHENYELVGAADIEYVTSISDCYSVEVVDCSYGDCKLLHREFFSDFSEAEDRYNANCIDVFADGMYGEPEHMEVTMTDGTFDVILAMDSVDFAFFTDNN